MMRVHGTSVAIREGDHWVAVLLRGVSGAGKSDLALRLIEVGARLVADDQSELAFDLDQIMVSAPENIAGRLEVRGLGIVDVDCLKAAPLALVCDLCAPEDIPRMPPHETVRFGEHDVPMLRIAPFEISAPIKVRLGVAAARRGILGGNF